MIGMTDAEGRSLVAAAAEGGSLEIFEEVLGLLGGKVRRMISQVWCRRRRLAVVLSTPRNDGSK